jgi:hypothetical protein
VSLTTDAAAVTAPRPTWQDQRRLDEHAQAQIDREREDRQAANKLAAIETAARLKRDADDAREARKTARTEARRQARGKSWGKVTGWIGGHVKDLLLAPVIVVPGVLAWTAMATYGASVYGSPGRMLPAFSEGAMWAFAVAVKITRHGDARPLEDDPAAEPSPVWHLLLGTAVFAGFGFALNFSHGYAVWSKNGATTGIATGLFMGLISVAGVTADQIVNAGPRRTRAEKDAARLARRERKRLAEAARKAVDTALVELDANGTARLIYQAAPAIDPETSAPEADTDTASQADTSRPRPPANPRPRKRTPRADTAKPPGRTRQADSTTADAVARLRAKNPGMPAAVIAERLGVSARTVRRHLADQAGTPPAGTA